MNLMSTQITTRTRQRQGGVKFSLSSFSSQTTILQLSILFLGVSTIWQSTTVIGATIHRSIPSTSYFHFPPKRQRCCDDLNDKLTIPTFFSVFSLARGYNHGGNDCATAFAVVPGKTSSCQQQRQQQQQQQQMDYFQSSRSIVNGRFKTTHNVRPPYTSFYHSQKQPPITPLHSSYNNNNNNNNNNKIIPEPNPQTNHYQTRLSLSSIPYTTVLSALEQQNLYPPQDLEQRNAQSRKDGYWKFINEGLDPPLELTYGEFDFYFFADLLDRSWLYFCCGDDMKAGDLEKERGGGGGGVAWENKVFADIGSGTGRLVLGAAALHPHFKLCRGLEVLESIHEVALEKLQECKGKPVESSTVDNHDEKKGYNEEEEEEEEWSAGNILFGGTNSFGIDEDLIKSLQDHFDNDYIAEDALQNEGGNEEEDDEKEQESLEAESLIERTDGIVLNEHHHHQQQQQETNEHVSEKMELEMQLDIDSRKNDNDDDKKEGDNKGGEEENSYFLRCPPLSAPDSAEDDTVTAANSKPNNDNNNDQQHQQHSNNDETTYLPMAPVEFTCGSFKDPYEYLGDIDCAFVFSSCMSSDLMSDLSAAIGRHCKPGTIIITTEFPLNLDGTIEPLPDDENMPFGPYKIEMLESIDGYCWLTGGQSTAYIHRVVKSLWVEGVGRREKPVLPLEEQAYRIVKALESGELTDTKKFMRNVYNNMIFSGLPEEWRPNLEDEEDEEDYNRGELFIRSP